MSIVSLRGVEKSVGGPAGRTWLLRQIDLDIQAGEFLVLTGPSGAGKSTLLAILGLLDADWSGSYLLDGQAVQKLGARDRAALARQTIGFIFQQYHLLDDLTVAENLEVPLTYRDVPARERQARVADVLDRFGIVGKKDLYPSQLSGGQQQLVGVARAVIARPALILADEPTGSLHSSQGRVVMETLAELHREGTTIVQVTHDPVWAAWGQRRVEMRDGWIVTESTAPTG